MSTRAFGTRHGRITLTDETLIYEQTLNQLWRASHRVRSVARADILEIHLVTHVHRFTPEWTEVIVLYRGGVLNIPHMVARTAEALKAALGF
jgi:hypothetical protein